jgi:hypothetical protein
MRSIITPPKTQLSVFVKYLAISAIHGIIAQSTAAWLIAAVSSVPTYAQVNRPGE